MAVRIKYISSYIFLEGGGAPPPPHPQTWTLLQTLCSYSGVNCLFGEQTNLQNLLQIKL